MKKIIFIALSLFALQTEAQIKAIRIKTTVQLTSGLTIPSGALIVISEGYANISAKSNDSIPCQVSTLVYASFTDYNDGKESIPNESIKDFSPAFTRLKMAVADYVSLPTQDLLIGVVQNYLNGIYPGKIEIITL